MARQTNKNKASRCRYDTDTRQGKTHGKAVSLRHHGNAVYNLEMHDLQFGIVIPLSYLCIVEEH